MRGKYLNTCTDPAKNMEHYAIIYMVHTHPTYIYKCTNALYLASFENTLLTTFKVSDQVREIVRINWSINIEGGEKSGLPLLHGIHKLGAKHR